MSDWMSTPRKIAAGMLYERLRTQTVLTVEAIDEALLPVFAMLYERGVIDPDMAIAEEVPCPRCGVDAYRPCRDAHGDPLTVPHWQRARKWEHAQDTREHRIGDLSRDLSRMVGLAGLAAREAGR